MRTPPAVLEQLKLLPARVFEKLTYDLLLSAGIRNLTWRTPGADGGRDVEGEVLFVDFSGYEVVQKWFVDCKRYNSSVSWPVVHEKASYADSSGADYLLIVTTASLSPKCIDEVQRWNKSHKQPLIRAWAGADLEIKIKSSPILLVKYGFETLPNSVHSHYPILTTLMKIVLAAQSKAYFDSYSNRYIEAAAAISELLCSRIDPANDSYKFYFQRFSPDEDAESWIDVSTLDPLAKYDRNNIKALSSFGCLAFGAPSVVVRFVSVKDYVLEFVTPRYEMTAANLKVLEQIAIWANVDFCVCGRNITIGERYG